MVLVQWGRTDEGAKRPPAVTRRLLTSTSSVVRAVRCFVTPGQWCYRTCRETASPHSSAPHFRANCSQHRRQNRWIGGHSFWLFNSFPGAIQAGNCQYNV